MGSTQFDFFIILSTLAWLVAMGGYVYLINRQLAGFKTGKYLKVKRRLMLVSVSLLLGGVIPLLARVFLILDLPLADLIRGLSAFSTALCYLGAFIGFFAIYKLDPYNPKDGE